jgi:starvation-inducible DNA-binding protein
MKTHKTKNDLPSNAKSTVIGILNESLASVIDLALVTKQAHWNLKGPQFIAVHELLDTFRAQLDNHGDTIAERVVQLGGTALGSLQSVSSSTKLKAYTTYMYLIHDLLDALIERYGYVYYMMRKAIDDSD